MRRTRQVFQGWSVLNTIGEFLLEGFINSIMQSLGVSGIALLMFLENIFPPIPSELIMPLAGYLASQGDMSIVAVIVAGSIGTLLGIIPWYVLGMVLGKARLKAIASRHGRWLTMSPADIDRAGEQFEKYGRLSVLLGRLVPTVRTLISVPAGITRMPFWQFLVYSSIGSVIWTAALALSGYALGQAYTVVKDYVDPVSTAVLVLIVLVYAYRVVTFKSVQS